MSLTNATPLDVAKAAQHGARTLAVLSTDERNAALTAIHRALAEGKEEVLAANRRDLEAANQAVQNGRGLSESLVKRLDLGKPGKYEDMLQGILDVRKLDDPIGQTTARTLLDDDLVLSRITCPIGVLLVIFEARPEVIANISALALKSGNAAILKGGRESAQSFAAIATLISRALASTAVPADCLQLVQTHDAIADLLKLDDHIDLCIPRGGNKLVKYVKSATSIPVLGHADGICTTYLCADYPVELATKVLLDAKTSYPAGCNSLEQLLVDPSTFTTTLPAIAQALLNAGVSLRCDALSLAALSPLVTPSPTATLTPADPQDYTTEFLSLTLLIATVPSLPEAISHINTFSSHHTDAILTLSPALAEPFLRAVDSASVYWNTSTRMADGQRYGFGTEVGISTNKIHSRGPVGLEGLTIYKWIVRGKGQVSGEYGAGEGKRRWRHEALPLVVHETRDGIVNGHANGHANGHVIGHVNGDRADAWTAKNDDERELLRRFRAGTANA